MNDAKVRHTRHHISTAGLWFYAHFALEVLCFHFYYMYFHSLAAAGLISFGYDMAAFLPQVIIGRWCDSNKRFEPSYVGVILAVFGFLLNIFIGSTAFRLIPFLLISAGNAFIHVAGAKDTLSVCGGRLSPPAVFVAGGSFGVVTGRLLGVHNVPIYVAMMVFIPAVFCMIMSGSIRKSSADTASYDIADKRRSTLLITVLSFFVVAARGLVGYGIPTYWVKSEMHTVLLFCGLGLGKAFGGILSDIFGAKRTALVSTALSLPLIFIGRDIMWISLIAVTLFSMTMATALGILVSVYPDRPVTAYGITVAGLLFGSLFVFIRPYAPVLFSPVSCTVLIVLVFAALCLIMKRDSA
ncbi:MAG: hypothetical protein ILP19_02215 [Oscillospiraceae bacterium]|nr:hypothetical protein [Oscillospiraceae bacterium]